MPYQYHDESIITSLPEDTIFVFGSNLAGQHAGGAARTAHKYFGAVMGVGRGWAGQSFAIPTLNEHLQQMPLSQIEHYVEDFKVYAKNHPKMKYFLTPIGCGIAGYQIKDIAPFFKGISANVILPQSFQPYVEQKAKQLFPTLRQDWVKAFLQDKIIFYPNYGYSSYEQALEDTRLTKAQKQIALQVLQEPMYPEDRYGRGREFEISDTLNHLSKIFHFQDNSEGPMIFVGTIIALMELYEFDEQEFIELWQGQREIVHPAYR